jgi:hypothetical protein
MAINEAEGNLINHLLRRHPEARLAATILVGGVTSLIAPRGQRQVGLALLLVSAVVLTSMHRSEG